jgi:hypothetical protein
MSKTVNEIFNQIQKTLDEIGKGFSREENRMNMLDSFDRLDQHCSLLRSEVDREIRLYQMERDLYLSRKSLNDTLENIVGIIKNEFSFAFVDIVIVDHDLKRILRRYSKGCLSENEFLELVQKGVISNIVEYCFENSEPKVVNTHQLDNGLEPSGKIVIQSYGIFPLKYKKKSGEEEVMGYLLGAWSQEDFKNGKFFTESDVKEMKRLSCAIATSVRESKLNYFEHAVIRIQNEIG